MQEIELIFESTIGIILKINKKVEKESIKKSIIKRIIFNKE